MINISPTEGRVRHGELDVDLVHLEVFIANTNTPAALRPQAARLLVVLAENPEQVVTKQTLMDAVWPDVVVTDDSIVQAVRDVRQALGDKDHRLVRTVRGRGYRLMKDQNTGDARSEKKAAITSPESAAGWKSGLPKKLFVLPFVLVLVSYNMWDRSPPKPSSQTSDAVTGLSALPGIAVFPFQELESESGIGKWLAEDLVHALARDGRIRVISQYSSFAASSADTPAAELFKTLTARYLVNGHVIRQDEAILLEVQLVDLSADQVVWSDSFSSESETVVAMTNSIKNRLAGRLLTSVKQASREQALLSEPSSMATYGLTQRALALKHRFNQSATVEARSLLQQAMSRDPDYAAPKAVLCWVNALDALFQFTGQWSSDDANVIIDQCQSSIALDPLPAMPHIALADAYLLAGKLDEAADSARQATERAPSDAEAWLLYAFHLLPVESAFVAKQALDRALPLFPIKLPFVNLLAAQVAWASGDLELASESATACVQATPHFDICSAILALVYTEQGEDERAQEQLISLSKNSVSFKPQQACSRFTGTTERHNLCLSVLGG